MNSFKCSFKDFAAQVEMKRRAGMSAGEQYELHKIICADAFRGLLVVKRSEIDGASGYDFTLT